MRALQLPSYSLVKNNQHRATKQFLVKVILYSEAINSMNVKVCQMGLYLQNGNGTTDRISSSTRDICEKANSLLWHSQLLGNTMHSWKEIFFFPLNTGPNISINWLQAIDLLLNLYLSQNVSDQIESVTQISYSGFMVWSGSEVLELSTGRGWGHNVIPAFHFLLGICILPL